MANLKLDLLNKLKNEKYYSELEMIRLANEPNMNYKEKIDSLSDELENIAIIDAQTTLVEQYFKEPATAATTPDQKTEMKPVHKGQTHGE